MLDNYITEVEDGDITNREGHAAKVYFNALLGFSRKDSEEEINSALNYGYSMLMSAMAREVVAAGYLTQIGIWHRSEQNSYNLACDLMEPFRPIVDSLVMKIYKDKKSEVKFKKELQTLYLTTIKINGHTEQLYPAMRVFLRRVLKYLQGEVENIYTVDDFKLKEEDEL
jgi:CRISPR-associated endonuclease Cas1 subtype II